MIEELKWDSKFFNKKIGELKVVSEQLPNIETIIEKAKKGGFRYIVCKIQSQQTDLIKLLESSGFYLSDIGVTWAVETDKFIYKKMNKNSNIKKSINIAAEKDIPMLKKMVKSLFLESRFYNDPFFSKEEADNLYQTWIENSVKGNVADVVFHIPDIGFITCKKLPLDIGEIVLIGIKKDFRGKGIGTILIEEAIKWFKMQGLDLITVRTQLKNLNAMNFYVRSGFYIKGYDIVFAMIL
jgi:dTDP-4-amino-4,6-dideoxy-D-galactose acyltransferase